MPAIRMIRYYLPAIIWILMVLYVCTIPGEKIPSSPFFEKIHMDKIVHFGLFGGTVFLLCLGVYLQKRVLTKFTLTLIALSASFYGLAIEYIQKYIAIHRSFDMSDVAADTVGAIAGIIAFNLVRKWWLK
ncbi:VanZ family protein [Chitinophaga filiformis]|nr:VanZ family protein [Chitinophaga filiformis]